MTINTKDASNAKQMPTSVCISSSSGPVCVFVDPAAALPKADAPGLPNWNAILALSKVGEAVLISRFKGIKGASARGNLGSVVNECDRDAEALPDRNCKARSRLASHSHQ